MIKARTLISLLALAVVAAVAQAAEPTRAEMLVKFRKAAMDVLAGSFSPLGAMADGKLPYDAKRAQVLAQRTAVLAGIAGEVFPPESKTGGETKAKPEIWSNRAEFDQRVTRLLDTTAALASAAKPGTLEALKPAVGDVGQSCKACHDKFKAK
jgi:cytochrome c556